MPTILTDDPSSFPCPIQAPAAGDPRTDTSVETPLQQFANRTANTKARLDVVSPFSAPGATPLPSGVTVGQTGVLVAQTLLGMRSIPAAQRFDGMLCFVYPGALYQFSASLAAAPATPWLFRPADITSGPGLWVRQGWDLLGLLGGLPQLDDGARLPAATERLSTLSDQFTQQRSVSFGTSSTPTAVTGASAVVPGVEVGDVFEVRATCLVTVSLATTLSLTHQFTLPSSATVQGFTIWAWQFADPGSLMLEHSCTYVATEAGSHTAQLMAASVAAVTTYFANLEYRVKVTRP